MLIVFASYYLDQQKRMCSPGTRILITGDETFPFTIAYFLQGNKYCTCTLIKNPMMMMMMMMILISTKNKYLGYIYFWGRGRGAGAWVGVAVVITTTPDLLYRISTIHSIENTFLKSPQNSSLLTLITQNSAFKHTSFVHSDAYK